MTSSAFQRNPCAFYFGKIKSRGDFVKSAGGARVIALIDRWIAQGMEDLIAVPHWKACYDHAEPIDFLFMGTQRKHAIHGTIVPGSDASLRRFPFVAGTVFEVAEPHQLLTLGPICFDRHTTSRRRKAELAVTSDAASDALAWLSETGHGSCLSHHASAEHFSRYLASTTVADLTNLLRLCDREATIRQIVLALRCLLYPLQGKTSVSIYPPSKGIALPLPEDSSSRPLVEAFWLTLMNVFLRTTDLELSLLSGVLHRKPKMIITFSGVTPLMFRAIFDEDAAREFVIDLSNAAWAEHISASDSNATTLSAYLDHDSLLLQQIVMTFQEMGHL